VVERMNKIFEEVLMNFKFMNDLYSDSYNLLMENNRRIVAEHSREVAIECKMLAKRFGINTDDAETAGFLHDISAIYPNEKRLEIANILGIEVLEEEKEFPLILHQKISQVMVREIWNIKDVLILNAIGCHTTLRDNPSQLDLVLFVADKIKWDQKGIPPYINELQEGLNISLEHGAYGYIKYLMDNKSNLKVVHPWLKDAYDDLRFKLNVLD
jgi:predicted HD superfamily hydrolase involved in NAD metabolism